MEYADKVTKRALSLLLCLILVVSTAAFALSVSAEETGELTEVGDTTYYFYGEASNSPNFTATSPTGTFSYDSAKGYYYFDLPKFSGDYCFVVSTVSNSAANAVKSPAVTIVSGSGYYYLSSGNYHGFNCMHLWNPNGDMVRVYFIATNIGLTAVSQTAADPTQAPTQKPTAQSPTQAPTSGGGTTPTTPSPTQAGGDSGKTYVYCENEVGWTAVYAYMWNSDSDKNAEWPGVKMTNIGGKIWRYEYKKSYANIIFNIGSNQTQTTDMVFPGAGYIFNNADNSWEIYDTSPLQVASFTTDVDSPQYNGVGITLSASAEGQGTVYYKFSVTSGSNTVVLSDYSTRSQVQWIPQVAGTYTLTYEFRDASGNTNKRTKSFTIEDGLASVSPYIKTVTPSGGEIRQSTAVNVSVAAGGGMTGTNLLFYKFTVKDASGTIVNVPYYTLNSTYRFTPTAKGAYTVTVDVQGSDNKTVERTYSYTSVASLTPTEPPATEAPTTAPQPTQAPTLAPTQPAPTQAPTQAPTKPAPTQAPTQAPTKPAPTQAPTQAPTDAAAKPFYGDADDDGEITILDVTYIQRYEVDIPLPTPLNFINADVDGDKDVIIIDATLVQRFLAGIIQKFPVE